MDKEKCLQLIELIKTGSKEEVEAFYDKNDKAFSTPLNRDRIYALHCAVIVERLDLVELILKKQPATLEAKDSFAQTPLLWAAAHGYKDIIVYLMNQGANCTISGSATEPAVRGNRSIVGWAKYRRHLECVDIIHEMQYQQIIKVLASLANPSTAFDSITLCISNLIKAENIRGLDHILEDTLYFKRLPVNYRLQLLTLAYDYLESDVLVKFLALRHKWPAQVNLEGYSVLEWAVSKGLERFLTIFSAMGMDYLPSINNNFGDPVQRNLLDLAKKHGQLRMLNALILHSFHAYQNHITEPSSSDETMGWALYTHLANYILSGEQLIELAAIEKALLPLLLQTPNYRRVLDSDLNVRSEGAVYRTYFASDKQRRNSLECVLDPVSQTIEIFRFKRLLGRGSYGSVREFINEKEQSRAVKSFNQPHEAALRSELSFLRRVYPQHSFFGFIDRQSSQSRLTMPCFKGEFFESVCNRLTSDTKLAQLIHAMALAIHQVHKTGIIHGDITNFNLLVHEEEGQWIVQLIDFGISYSINTGYISGFDVENNRDRYPPELIGAHIRIKPHPRQDVYMLGALLKLGIRSVNIENKITQAFPLIMTFIERALSIDPEKRPSLEDFCTDLANALDTRTIVAEAGPSGLC